MQKTMLKLLLLAVVLVPCCSGTETIYITDDVSVSELFSLRIEPRMFNWSYEGLSEQFHYRSSLEGYPDLPSWIRYMYSTEYHSGFLYGTPPPRTADTRVPIEIIALNRMSYETKRLVLMLAVHHKPVAKHVIQMKIDNLNWVHMMDPGRIENLKNIFRNDLWPESRSDLHIIFMDSAVKLGARLPLRPQQREGVVVHLGSRAEFSGRMLDLQEEVKPLYKIASCTYKRTSVQTTFENSGFKLDWCAFRLTSSDDDITALPHHPNESHKDGDHTNLSGQHVERWDAPLKSEIPERNYSDEVAISFAIPGMIFALLLCGLTIILCFQHEKLQDDDSEYYFNYIFYICSDFLRMHKSSRHEYNMVPSNVQMVHYSPEDAHSTIKLKSLRDAPFDVEPQRISSPSDSFYREGSPHISNMYMRPKPPPYKLTGNSSGSPTLNRNHADNGEM
ncbi:alpha-sarcoglycan isoform X1 [Anopheles darlingi]|uniref:alpha-sarcoglycan isoform X1 n=1 Tax=Anopheles darlingi TaxID=43151 RepID=UPI0021003158|nr:alpha-sarcoglycan isoform X1 [Anopheles darlingi]